MSIAERSAKLEAVFVDKGVADWPTLVAEIKSARPGAAIELIDGARRGLAQMAAWARQHSGYDAIHVLSHGSPACLALGSDEVTVASLATEAAQLELHEIGQALGAGGEVLLYGCNVAAGMRGRVFIDALARAARVVVAASTTATGAAALGGTWLLEAATAPLRNAPLALRYDGVLSRPSSGTTDFENYGPQTQASGSSTGAGLTANDVDGWDFTLKSAADPDDLIMTDSLAFSTIIVEGISTRGLPLERFIVKADDQSLFTLNSVDVSTSGDSNAVGGILRLVGYRNGVAVPGAEFDQSVPDTALIYTPVTFNVSGNSAFQGIDEFDVLTDGSYQVTNSFGVDNINATDFVTPGPIVTTDSGSASFTAGDNVASTPVVIDSGLTIADATSGTLGTATVSITGNLHAGEDVLGFINNGLTMGNILASYDGLTGILSLSSAGATANVAQWQAALASVTYTDIATTPISATRTISFTANDGAITGAAATRTVTVTDTDQTPIVTASGGSTAFTAANNAISTPVVVDSAITVADLDNTLAAATVSITANFRPGQDVLAFDNTSSSLFGNIFGSYSTATGMLFLSSPLASATLTQWQAALRAVTYTDTAVTPNTANRTISFAVDDGITTSATTNRTVTVADTDQSPVVTTSGGSAAFTQADNTTSTPVAVDSFITVTDLDDSTLASAAVSITNYQILQDVLAFTNDNASLYGNIGAAFDNMTGVLTLSSFGRTASDAQWQNALRAVTYTDLSIFPDTAARTVSFTVNDGTVDSAAVTRSVTIARTDQTPTLTTSGGSAAFVEADGTQSTPVPVDPAISIFDRDNSSLASATVSITGNFQSGEDVLAFTNDGSTEGNIVGSYANGVLTLSSAAASANLAQWATALRRVTYTDTSVAPNTATRTVSVVINDGAVDSAAAARTVTVAATAQSPIVIPSSGVTTASTVPSTPVAIDSGITVSDLDSSSLASATVWITANFNAGEDVLGFVNTGGQGNITGAYSPTTGVLTLSSSGAAATDAQWQAALRAVTYADTSSNPTAAPRTISFAVSDGAATSVVATHTVTVAGASPITPSTVGVYRFFDTGSGEQFLTADVNERNAITNPQSPGYRPGLVAETNGFGAATASDPNATAVYRFFDKITGAHFFTASATERDAIVNPAASDFQANYVYEPNASFYEHATQQTGDVAVFRLFNTTNGTHFYTSDAAELAGITTRGSASFQPSLVSEGVAFYAPTGALAT